MDEIKRMIAQTQQWRLEHRGAKRKIEAAACAIRERALRDALAVLEKENHR